VVLFDCCVCVCVVAGLAAVVCAGSSSVIVDVGGGGDMTCEDVSHQCMMLWGECGGVFWGCRELGLVPMG
jgi:hypothetical protein